eukprot:s2537_g2.t2
MHEESNILPVYDEADYEAKLSAKGVYGLNHFTSLCAADAASFTYAEFHALSFQELDTDGVAESTDPGHLLSEAVLQPEGTAISDDDIGELLASAAASVFSLLKLKLNKLVTRSYTSHVETVKKERLNHALVESVAEVATTDGPPVSREDRMQWARKILAHLKDQKPQEASAASDDIVPLPKALMERVKKRVASAEQNWRNCRAIHTAWNKQGTTIEVSDGLPAEGRIGRRRHKELEDD